MFLLKNTTILLNEQYRYPGVYNGRGDAHGIQFFARNNYP